MTMKNFLVSVIFVLVGLSSFAQGTIRGFIKDKDNGEALSYILVGLEGTAYGVNTDNDGYFSLTKVPAGTYTLVIKTMEFVEIREQVVVQNDKVLTKNYLLERNVVELGGVEITSEGSEQRNSVNISVESIRVADIKRVPSFGGQADIVQVLTTLPGFVSTGDQGGQIFVRGGSPVQNKVLLDGMIVYSPFHSIGLFSVFDTDIIASADVFTGGFGAQYGGRISSVMDITTRDGNKKSLNGRVGASPFGSKVLIEGPLKKLTEKGSGISFVLSAKNSYLDKTAPEFYPYINDGNGLPFSYRDLYGKVSFGGSNGSKFNIFGFSFDDAVDSYQNVSNLKWNNVGLGSNFVVSPATSPVLISGNFAWSKYRIELLEEALAGVDRSSEIKSFNFGLDFKYTRQSDVLNYGIDVVGLATSYNTINPLGVKINLDQNTTELNGFFTYRFNREKFVFEPGIRIQYYSSLSRFSPEPRLGFKYKASERFRLKAATGIYTQNLMATNSDQDVVNLFYGFLPGQEDLPDTLTLANGNSRATNNPLQRAIHYILGFEFDVTDQWNLNVEGYYRDFRAVTNTNRYKIFEDNADNANRPEYLRKNFILETGFAMGIDVSMKYETKTTSLNFVYSLGNVDRWDGTKWYDPVFDRRHNINVVLAQKFGDKRDWDVSVRWNLGSGLPFTQTQGYYEAPSNGGTISSDYLTANADAISIDYAELNKGRLPYYHRLDMNVRKVFKFEKSNLEVNAGLTNAYNRANVFYINRVTAKRIDQLPILPSLGIEFSF
ncbi:MAG: hypothetical protein RLZZ77_578 [Bacteroidota bacterium]|jgi:hypothetical protein